MKSVGILKLYRMAPSFRTGLTFLCRYVWMAIISSPCNQLERSPPILSISMRLLVLVRLIGIEAYRQDN